MEIEGSKWIDIEKVLCIFRNNSLLKNMINSKGNKFLMILSLLLGACGKPSQPEDKHDTVRVDTTAIDFVASNPERTKVLLENEYVRVIEYTLKPGERDKPHTHPPKTSYVITGGRLRVYPENEAPFETEEVTGVAEWAGKRGKHYVENIGATTVTIVLTEVKRAKE
jgi:beta-alanine degradation protein BauB